MGFKTVIYAFKTQVKRLIADFLELDFWGWGFVGRKVDSWSFVLLFAFCHLKSTRTGLVPKDQIGTAVCISVAIGKGCHLFKGIFKLLHGQLL